MSAKQYMYIKKLIISSIALFHGQTSRVSVSFFIPGWHSVPSIQQGGTCTVNIAGFLFQVKIRFVTIFITNFNGDLHDVPGSVSIYTKLAVLPHIHVHVAVYWLFSAAYSSRTTRVPVYSVTRFAFNCFSFCKIPISSIGLV